VLFEKARRGQRHAKTFLNLGMGVAKAGATTPVWNKKIFYTGSEVWHLRATPHAPE
jgi:hypothetical protein